MAGLKDIGIRRLLPKHIDYSKSIPQLKVTGSFTVGQFNTTGSIEFDYTSPVTHNHLKRSAINIAASNNDVSIFRVTNSKPISAVSNFGFNLFYSGSGTGDNNRLVLMTDNQTAGTQVESLYINQTGDVYFGNGNIIIDSSTGDLYLKDQAKLVFDYDVTNTYIAASSGTPEDLEIHADDDIWLMPDDDVNIAAGSTGYATFNGGSKLLLLQSDTDAEYVALQLWNESDAADTTGKVSMQFWLENSSGTAIDSGKILVAKEQTFTSTTSTQDSKMEFHTSLDGTMSEKMTLSSAGNLSVDGTLTCATSLTIGSAAMSEADLEKLDGITDGTAAANKALVVDGNLDIGTIRNLTTNGAFSSETIHVNRNATIGSIGSFTVGNAGLRIQDSTANMYLDGNSIVSDETMIIAAEGAKHVEIATNGVQRLKIESGGDVGIGLNNPLCKFHIYEDLAAPSDLGEFNNYHLVIQGETDTGKPAGMLLTTSDNGYGGSAIVHYDTDTGGKGNLVFYTKQSTSEVPPAEVMRLTDSGKIGIGTDDPKVELDILEMGGLILDISVKDPGTAASYSVTTSFASIVSNNYALFTAPKSGKVLLSAQFFLDDISAAEETQTLTATVMSYNGAAWVELNSNYRAKVWETLAFIESSSPDSTINISWVVTGLTPGTNYYLSPGVKSSSASKHTLRWGGDYPHMIVKAESLPNTIRSS